MINGLKISAALLGVVAMFASVELSTCSVLSTASAQVCGCGNASCGGCLAGLRSRRAGAEVAYSADDPIVSTVYGEPVEVAGPVVGGCQSCRTCQKCQTCKPAPTAPCQYCTLESKKVKVDKTRFQVEQKEVCVPAVRLPWMKCNPPKRSRVRTVNGAFTNLKTSTIAQSQHRHQAAQVQKAATTLFWKTLAVVQVQEHSRLTQIHRVRHLDS